MKKILFVILIALSFNQLVFSQFKEGYIVDNSNDTIHGYIKWEGSIINSNQCSFKLNPEGEAKVYNPGDITAFRFDDGKFFSTWELKKDNKSNKIFIEWLIKGRASLLAYTNVGLIEYFLLTEDGKVTELTNSSYEFVKENVSYKRNKQEYINTLLFNFRDCPALDLKIKSTPFKAKSLIKVTKEYHELTCKTENCIVFEEKHREMIFNWGLYMAYQNSKWLLNNNLPEKVYPVNSIGYGVALNISNLPALSPKFSAKINLAVFSSIYRYDTTKIWSLISDDRICKIVYAKMPFQLSYRFTQTKFSPYLSAGGILNLRFSYRQYDHYLTDLITKSRPGNSYALKVKPHQFGATAGLGFDYIMSTNLRFNLGYDFEYCPRFYGTYIDDRSHNINNIVYLRAYFIGKRK